MKKRISCKIDKIEEVARDVKHFTFKHHLKAKPGQFIMLTDYENGEKPFSISDCYENKFSITVKKVGPFTSHLFDLSVNDYLAFRGAYGSSFFMSKNKVLVIGGGCAVPPLYFLCKSLIQNKGEITLINGARNHKDVIFKNRFNDLPIKHYIMTDDGSAGEKGTSVDKTEQLLASENFDYIYAAGPEMMLKNLQSKLGKNQYQFLLERYMKCAIGICGQCTLDDLGIRVCVEGPVFAEETINRLTEFGHYHRDASGKRIKF